MRDVPGWHEVHVRNVPRRLHAEHAHTWRVRTVRRAQVVPCACAVLAICRAVRVVRCALCAVPCALCPVPCALCAVRCTVQRCMFRSFCIQRACTPELPLTSAVFVNPLGLFCMSRTLVLFAMRLPPVPGLFVKTTTGAHLHPPFTPSTSCRSPEFPYSVSLTFHADRIHAGRLSMSLRWLACRS